MMYFDVKSVFAARGITDATAQLTKAGMKPQTARNLVYKPVKTLLFPHLELICRLCYCTPNDLIHYKPDENISLPENHPLNELKDRTLDAAAIDLIRTMPLNQLKKMVQSVAKENA